MNNKLHQEAVKRAIAPKFKGKEEIAANTIPLYPKTAERELKRVYRCYLLILNREVKAHLPEIMALCRKQRMDAARHDDIADFRRELRKIIQVIAQAIERAIGSYKLREKIEAIATMVKNTSVREWKRIVRSTLGIDLLSDYYDGSFYSAAIQQWVADAVNKIQSIPAQELGEMEAIIQQGYLNGKTIREIAGEIQKEYNVTKSKAVFLARDQVGTLNAQITKHQQEDAGVHKYKWSDSGDERVRDCHHALNGTIHSWDDPPAMWRANKHGIVYTGRNCHPGEDYACRCCAIPVFTFDTIDLPMKGADEKKDDYDPVSIVFSGSDRKF